MGDEVGGCGEGGAAAAASVVQCWVLVGIAGGFFFVRRNGWGFVAETEVIDFGRCAGCVARAEGALVEPAVVGWVCV